MKTEYIFLKLKTLTPVHIGCAEIYEPTSFYIDKSSNELVHFNMAGFIELLENNELHKLNAICREGTPASLIKLWRFIREQAQAFRVEGQRVPVCNGLINHYDRTLGISLNDSRKLKNEINQFQIFRSAFDPITGLLYLPGSAIKGSIRTAILNQRLKSKKDLSNKQFKGRKPSLKLQQEILEYRHLESDPFRLLKISDFIPTGQVSRKIVYAVNQKKQPNKFKPKAPYQIMEIIEPDTTFVGIISIQKPLKSNLVRHPLTKDEVLDAVKYFFGKEKSREDKELSHIGVNPTKLSQGLPIRIGRHSGAECVTIYGHREILIMKENQKSEFKEYATTVWLTSPSSRPSNISNLQPFGWMILNELPENEWTAACNKIDAIRSTLFQKAAEEFQKKSEEREKAKARQAEEERRRLEAAKYPWRAKLETILKTNRLDLLKKKVLNDPEMSKWLEEVDEVQQAIKDKVDALVKDIAPTISDWGILKQQLLENELVKKWAKEPSIADAIKHAALEVAQKAHKKGKWSDERDELVRNFLEDTGQIWDLVLERTGESPELESRNSVLMEKIKDLDDWTAFKSSAIKIQELDLGCCKALMERFKAWKMGKSKDKQERNKFKALQKRIKNLEKAARSKGK